ncbi:glycopeptide antibiotics resistance protein [Arthrobacter sp. UYEF6]
MFAFLHMHGVPSWFDYPLVESGSNALLFVPFGFLMTMCFPANPRWLNIATGFLASCTVELGQLVFLNQRFPSIWDVAANTAGTAVGVALAIRRTLNRRSAGTHKSVRSQP